MTYLTYEAHIVDGEGVDRNVYIVCDGLGKHLSAIDSNSHILFSFNDWDMCIDRLLEAPEHKVEVHRYYIGR